MSARAAILQKLTESRNTAVERAVETALMEATPAEQRELADVLLERNRRAGWIALIRAFHRLDESIREKLLTRPRDLFGPLAETMHDSQGPARENVISIVQKCTDVRLVYLLAEALMDARPDVRTLAGNSLLEAARRHWRKRREAANGPESNTDQLSAADKLPPAAQVEEAHQLRAAIDVALRHFKTHRQTDTLLAALIHERQQTSDFWLLFQDPYDDRTRAATIILRAPGEPALAASLMIALGTSLKPAAMAGLAGVEDTEVAAALVAESFRLADPALREAARGVSHLKLLPAVRKSPPWTRDTWAAWLRLIDGVGLAPAERLLWLSRLLESAPAGPEGCGWKMCVARAIAATDSADAAPPLMALLRDPDERVARCAARYLLGGHRSDWRDRAAVALPTSPHPSVRRMAGQMRAAADRKAAAATSQSTAARGFQKAWSDFQRMPPAVRNSAARVVTADPSFAELLRRKLEGSPQEIAQALRMIAAQPKLAPYRSQIIGLCGHADARVAATAVRLVGRLEDPRLRELLEAAAHHTDPRVRANAIESMAELNIVDRSQQVLAMLNSRHSRERANAIRALGQFNFATARECLARMLTDPNPLHRMSALWVVSQLNLLEVMRQVSNIARRDPNLRVRRRASDMLDTLSGNLAGHG